MFSTNIWCNSIFCSSNSIFCSVIVLVNICCTISIFVLLKSWYSLSIVIPPICMLLFGNVVFFFTNLMTPGSIIQFAGSIVICWLVFENNNHNKKNNKKSFIKNTLTEIQTNFWNRQITEST